MLLTLIDCDLKNCWRGDILGGQAVLVLEHKRQQPDMNIKTNRINVVNPRYIWLVT